MRIERICADWGDGSSRALELRDGLNLVERGQRDWNASLLAMLFGSNGQETDFKGGDMTCQAHNRTVTLRRKPDDVEIYVGQEDGTLSADNCGEILTGTTRELYGKLSCISLPPAADIPALQERLNRSENRMKDLQERETVLRQKLRRLEEGGEPDAPPESNVPDISMLTAAYSAMKTKLEADHVPEMDKITHLRGAIVNIMTAGRQLDKAEAEQEAAERALSSAKADVDAMPFAGMSPEEAERSPVRLPFRPFIPQWLVIVFGIAVVIGAVFLFNSPGLWYPVAWVLFVLAGILTGWLVRKWRERWEVRAVELRKQWEIDLVHYTELYHVMEAAQAEADIKISAADTLRESLSTNERGILREIHQFAPEVSTMTEADTQLQLCARRRKELSIAEAVVRKAEALAPASMPAISAVGDGRHVVLTNLAENNPPESSGGERDKLAADLDAIRQERSALRLEIRRDKEALKADTPLWVHACQSLETFSQTDASHALAERVTALFHDLTEQRFHDDPFMTVEDVSAGLADMDSLKTRLETIHCTELFALSVCFAACESALSGGDNPPLILQNALDSLDDASCASALRVLPQIAQHRQILLFTDDERQLQFGENHAEISVQRLTERP